MKNQNFSFLKMAHFVIKNLLLLKHKNKIIRKWKTIH